MKPGSVQKPSLPQFLLRPFQDIIVGLARQPLVNSYARTLPLVWKMGWAPVPEGPLKTELPPLPIEILKEKDVLDEFVKRVNLIGKVWLPVPDLSCVGFFFPNYCDYFGAKWPSFRFANISHTVDCVLFNCFDIISHSAYSVSFICFVSISRTLRILFHSIASLITCAVC